MRRITAHIRTKFHRMKSAVQKFQICAMRIINYKQRPEFVAYIGYTFYIKPVSEIVGRCDVHRSRRIFGIFQRNSYVVGGYVTAAKRIGSAAQPFYVDIFNRERIYKCLMNIPRRKNISAAFITAHSRRHVYHCAYALTRTFG